MINELSNIAARKGLIHTQIFNSNLVNLTSYNMTLIGKQELYNLKNETATSLLTILQDHVALMAYGKEASHLLSQELLPFCKSGVTVFAGLGGNKTSSDFNLTPNASVYGLYIFPGTGQRLPDNQFVEVGSYNASEIISNAVDWWHQIEYTNFSFEGTSIIGNVRNISSPAVLTQGRYTYAGSTNWMTNNVVYDGVQVAQEEVEIQYYYVTQVINSQTYYWFLSFTQHTTEGYSGFTVPVGNRQETSYATPVGTSEYLNAETSSYPGQQLFSFGPTGSQSCVQSVSYSLSGGSGGSSSASVAYTVNPSSISYSLNGNPSGGWLNWTHSFCGGQQSNTLYDLEPSAVIEINPTLSGGVIPMLVYNTYTASYQLTSNGAILPFASVSAPTMSFQTTVYTNSVSI